MKRVVKLKTAEKGLLLSCLVDGAVHVMWIHLDVDATSTWDDMELIHTCLIHTYIHTVYGRKCSRVTSCQVGRQQEVPVRSNSKGKREMHLCSCLWHPYLASVFSWLSSVLGFDYYVAAMLCFPTTTMASVSTLLHFDSSIPYSFFFSLRNTSQGSRFVIGWLTRL